MHPDPSLTFSLLCRGLEILVKEEWLVESKPDATGLILRQIFDLLGEQTVEPWSSDEVEEAAASIQHLLKYRSLEWLKVPLCFKSLPSFRMAMA